MSLTEFDIALPMNDALSLLRVAARYDSANWSN